MNASFTLFLALPAPLKLILFSAGSFAWFGIAQPVRVKAAPQVQAVPQAVPAQPVKPAPKPAATPADQPAAVKAPIIIHLSLENGYQFEGKKTTAAELRKKLTAIAKATPKRNCIVKAPSTLPLQQVQAALKLCRDAGLSNVGFTMEK